MSIDDFASKIDKETQAWLDVLSYCQVHRSEISPELFDLIKRFNQARNETTYVLRKLNNSYIQ